MKQDNGEALLGLLRDINQRIEDGFVPYNDKVIKVRFLESNDIIVFYNAIYFREHLKNSGFFYDKSDTSWRGDIDCLLNMNKNIRYRLLQACDDKSVYNLAEALCRYAAAISY
jgi:hypothetical protein